MKVLPSRAGRSPSFQVLGNPLFGLVGTPKSALLKNPFIPDSHMDLRVPGYLFQLYYLALNELLDGFSGVPVKLY